MPDPSQPAPPLKSRPAVRWMGFLVGLALLGSALWAVHAQHASLKELPATLRQGRWWLIGAALGLPILNWLITSAIFHVLMLPASRHEGARGPTFREMTLLIGSAWLLNYLPLSPGLIGRVAYHRAVHGIP